MSNNKKITILKPLPKENGTRTHSTQSIGRLGTKKPPTSK